MFYVRIGVFEASIKAVKIIHIFVDVVSMQGGFLFCVPIDDDSKTNKQQKRDSS